MPITEPALLTRCTWELNSINCTALLVYLLCIFKYTHIPVFPLQLSWECGPPSQRHPPPPLKLKFILFNFIFSIAPDHNRSHLKLPSYRAGLYLALLLNKPNSLTLFVLFTRRHVISVSNVTLHSRSLYAHSGVPPRCTCTHTHIQRTRTHNRAHSH